MKFTDSLLQCWCGNSIAATAVVAPITDCKLTCSGKLYSQNFFRLFLTLTDNSTEYCGAGSRLNVYQRNFNLSTSTSTSGVATTTAVTSSPTATAGPQVKQTVGNYVFQGCWTEATTARALASSTYADDSMTLESCAAYCSAYTMFGVEYGRECN